MKNRSSNEDNWTISRVLAALARLPGASKSQIQASILKDQEITVAQIGQAKSVTIVNIQLSIQQIILFCLGQVQMSFGQAFFIKIVQWASGDKIAPCY